MRRSLDTLLQDQAEQQEDELLRSQLLREEKDHQVKKRRKVKAKSFEDKWNDNLKMWDEMKLQPAGNFNGSPLAPAPIGPLCSYFPLLFIRLGAKVNLSRLPRHFTEYDCLMAELPPEFWTLLMDGTDSFLAASLSSGKVTSEKQFRPVSIIELKDVLFTRLDMIARGIATIDGAFKDDTRKDWYPSKARFYVLNGHAQCDIVQLARVLGNSACNLFHPAAKIVTDESMFAWEGPCECRRFIPRKPHPNGLLDYAVACYGYVGADAIPITLDYEPYTQENKVSAQEAMMLLQQRLHNRFPHLEFHLTVDSAFGSFDRMAQLKNIDTRATMSMPATAKGALWELLNYNCGIDEGRSAYIADTGTLVNSFQTKSEKGTIIQIKTITNAFDVTVPETDESVVVRITQRRRNAKSTEFLTTFADGSTEWLHSQSFISNDGSFNNVWLNFATANELEEGLGKFTVVKLMVRSIGVFPLIQVGNVRQSRLEIKWR